MAPSANAGHTCQRRWEHDGSQNRDREENMTLLKTGMRKTPTFAVQVTPEGTPEPPPAEVSGGPLFPPVLSTYFSSGYPFLPDRVNWWSQIKRWPMYANGKIGTCTAATVAHTLELWSHYSNKKTVIAPQKAVVNLYSAVSGYVRGEPDTDVGADLLLTMDYWRTHGLGKHKIDAYARVDGITEADYKTGIYLFGACIVGLGLPLALQSMLAAKTTWDVPPGQSLTGDWEPWSWSGHALILVGFTPDGRYVAVSWNGIYYITKAFLDAYKEYAYIPWSQTDWTRTGGIPPGFNATAIEADFAAMEAGGGINVVRQQVTGTWTVSYNGETTAALAYNASFDEVRTALGSLTSFPYGYIAVGLLNGGFLNADGGYKVVFDRALGRPSLLGINSYLVGPLPGVINIRVAVEATEPPLAYASVLGATSGEIAINNGDPLAYNASAEDVRANLSATYGFQVSVVFGESLADGIELRFENAPDRLNMTPVALTSNTTDGEVSVVYLAPNEVQDIVLSY